MINLIERGIRKTYFQIIKHFKDVITVKADFGVFRIYTKDKIIGYSLFKTRSWEMEYPKRAFEFLRENKIIEGKVTMLDLGANIGVTSIPFVNAGWMDTIVSVEADPDNFKLLSENIKINKLEKRIFPLHYGVTETTTELVLEKSQNNYGDHRIKKIDQQGTYGEHLRSVVKVPGDKLDNLVRLAPPEMINKSILIWIDIQGHEGYCFRGAKDWIVATKAAAISEVWPYGILRSGMSLKEFSGIIGSIWSSYYLLQNGKFNQHPVSDLLGYLEGVKGDAYDNVIFVP